MSRLLSRSFLFVWSPSGRLLDVDRQSMIPEREELCFIAVREVAESIDEDQITR